MKKKWKMYLAFLAAVVITVSALPVPSLAAPQPGTENQTDKQDTVSDETADNTQDKTDGKPSDETPAPGTDTAPAAQEGPSLFSMPAPVNTNAVHITSEADYLRMIADVNAGRGAPAYVQTADITLTDTRNRIGTKEHPFLSSYTGLYEGKKFKITVFGDNTDNYSIFGVIGDSDTAPSISNITANRRLADTITNGSITNCKVQSNVTLSEPLAMSDGTEYIGGFADIMSGGTVNGCYVNTKINADASCNFIGGFIGNLAGGTITNSFADTDITSAASGSDSFTAGGFAGSTGQNTVIQNSFSSGTMRVKGGGFAGRRRENSEISQCYTVMRLLADNCEPLALTADGSVTTADFRWSYQACGIEKRGDDEFCKTTSDMAKDGLFTDVTGISEDNDNRDPYCIGARIAVDFPENERSDLFDTAFTIPSQAVVGGSTVVTFESSGTFPQGIESSTDNTVTYDFRKGGSDLSGTINLTFDVNTGLEYISKSIDINLSKPVTVNNLSDFEQGSSHSRYILSSNISAAGRQLFKNFSGLIDGRGHTISSVGGTGSKPLIDTLENGGLIRDSTIEKPKAALAGASVTGTMENIIINSPHILAPGSPESEDDSARAVGAAANTASDGAVFSNIRVRNGEITTDENQGNIASGYAGGIVGMLGNKGDFCQVVYCISALNSITGRIAGGIAGNVKYGSITRSFSLGNIEGGSYSGGIAGSCDADGNGSIDKAYSSASVTAAHNAGGISPARISVKDSYFSGTFKTADNKNKKGSLYAIADKASSITNCYYDNLMAPQNVDDISNRSVHGKHTRQLIESPAPDGFLGSADQYPSLDTSDSACRWDAEDKLWQKAATLPIWIRAAEHKFADDAMDIKYPVKISTGNGFDYECPKGDVRKKDGLILAPKEKGDFEIKASLTGNSEVKKNFRLHTDGFTYLDSDEFNKLKKLDTNTNYCLLLSAPDEVFKPNQDYKPGEYAGTFLGDGAAIEGLRTPFVTALQGGRILGTVFLDSSFKASKTTGVIAQTMSDNSLLFACAGEGELLLTGDAEAAGGLVGAMSGSSSITDSYSLTRIRAEDNCTIKYTGGIAGTADTNSTISQTYFSGNISTGQNVGGIAGKVNSSDINKVYTYGQLTATSGGYASGIVAVSENFSSILNAFYAPEITCTSVDEAYGTWRTTNQLITQDVDGFIKHNTGSVRLPSLKNLEQEHSGLTGTIINTGTDGYRGLGITGTIPIHLAEGETLLNVKSEFILGDESQIDKWTAETLTQNPSAVLSITAKNSNTVAIPSCKNEYPITNSFKLTYTDCGKRVLCADLVNEKAKDVYRAVYDKEDDKNYYFQIKRFIGWEGEDPALADAGTTGRTQTVSYQTFRGTVPDDKIFKDTSGSITFEKDTTKLTVEVPKAPDSGTYHNKPLQFYLELTEASGDGIVIDTGNGDNCCKIKSQDTMINSDYIYQNADSSFSNAFENEAFNSRDGSEILESGRNRTYSVDPAKGSGIYGEYFSSIEGNIYVQVETGLKKKGPANSARNVSMDVSANSTGLFYGYEDIYNVNNNDALPYKSSDWNNAALNGSTITGQGEKQAFVIPADVQDYNIKVAVSNDDPSYDLSVNKIGTRALFGKEEAPWLKRADISRNLFRDGDIMYVVLQMNEIIEKYNVADSSVTLQCDGWDPVMLNYVAGKGTSRLLYSAKCIAPETSYRGLSLHYSIKDAEGVAYNKADILEGDYCFENVNIPGTAEPASVLMSLPGSDSAVQSASAPVSAPVSAPSTYANRAELTAADFASAEMFELMKRNLEMNLNVTDFDGEHVYQDQCDKITYLSMDGAGLTSMMGVGNLTNLTFLSLKDNRISSLDGIQNLMNLEELNLSRNQITSLTGLGNNPALKKLLVNRNQLTSTEGIRGCTALATFQAAGNQIATLAELPASLDTLMLSENQIASISGLEQLTGLKKLSLGDNPLRKIEGLDTLTGLNYLELAGCKIEQLDGINNLTGLKQLFLTRNSLKTLKNFDTLPAGIQLANVSLNDIDIKGEYKEYEALKATYGNRLMIGLQGAVDKAVYEQPKLLFYEDAVEAENFESAALLDGRKLSAGFTTAGPGKHIVSWMDGAAGDKLSETFHAEFTVGNLAAHPDTPGRKGAVKTGDTSLTGLYLLLMFAGALAAAFEIVQRKRRYQK